MTRHERRILLKLIRDIGIFARFRVEHFEFGFSVLVLATLKPHPHVWFPVGAM